MNDRNNKTMLVPSSYLTTDNRKSKVVGSAGEFQIDTETKGIDKQEFEARKQKALDNVLVAKLARESFDSRYQEIQAQQYGVAVQSNVKFNQALSGTSQAPTTTSPITSRIPIRKPTYFDMKREHERKQLATRESLAKGMSYQDIRRQHDIKRLAELKRIDDERNAKLDAEWARKKEKERVEAERKAKKAELMKEMRDRHQAILLLEEANGRSNVLDAETMARVKHMLAKESAALSKPSKAPCPQKTPALPVTAPPKHPSAGSKRAQSPQPSAACKRARSPPKAPTLDLTQQVEEGRILYSQRMEAKKAAYEKQQRDHQHLRAKLAELEQKKRDIIQQEDKTVREQTEKARMEAEKAQQEHDTKMDQEAQKKMFEEAKLAFIIARNKQRLHQYQKAMDKFDAPFKNITFAYEITNGIYDKEYNEWKEYMRTERPKMIQKLQRDWKREDAIPITEESVVWVSVPEEKMLPDDSIQDQASIIMENEDDKIFREACEQEDWIQQRQSIFEQWEYSYDILWQYRGAGLGKEMGMDLKFFE
jgi:hypothetical protein